MVGCMDRQHIVIKARKKSTVCVDLHLCLYTVGMLGFTTHTDINAQTQDVKSYLILQVWSETVARTFDI